MKLRKNDLQELVKGGTKSLETKLKEAKLELSGEVLKFKRGEVKNLRSMKTTRLAIAKVMTKLQESKLTVSAPVAEKEEAK